MKVTITEEELNYFMRPTAQPPQEWKSELVRLAREGMKAERRKCKSCRWWQPTTFPCKQLHVPKGPDWHCADWEVKKP